MEVIIHKLNKLSCSKILGDSVDYQGDVAQLLQLNSARRGITIMAMVAIPISSISFVIQLR
jgi:hypothetical protein